MKTTTKTDYIGTYTEYLYDDGHIETDPPGRPTSKEDVIRQRKAELYKTRTSRTLAADLAGGASVLRTTTKTYHETLNVLAEQMTTLSTPPAVRRTIINNVSLGGPLVGPAAGTRQEY
jgi:hypothetical protein